VTINQGIRLPAWFDLRPLDQPKDSVGIKHAAKEVQALIQEEASKTIPTKRTGNRLKLSTILSLFQEKRGTPGNRIVLGGFSQGGALALYSGLTGPVRLGGILALSTWLPIPQEIPWDKIQKLPILQCHGDQDPLISAATALKSSKLLETHLASSYTFKMYPGLEHNISSEEEMKDISTFFETVLPPSF